MGDSDMTRPKKGTAEAYAWAEKMRKHRERIRKAGRAAEKKFFSKGASLDPSRFNPGARWHEEASHVAGRYRKGAESATEKHIYAGMEIAHKDSASAARKLGMNPSLRSAHPFDMWTVTNQKSGRMMVLNTAGAKKYAGKRGYSIKQYHKSTRKRPKRFRKNPIAIYNPPKVAGTIYNHAIEIRAKKTSGNLAGKYKHVFGPNVQILGLDNGDVLLHHKDGKRLWISRKDYERSGGRHE
jgi:hypothetical protein